MAKITAVQPIILLRVKIWGFEVLVRVQSGAVVERKTAAEECGR
jgi:hypothetical protein